MKKLVLKTALITLGAVVVLGALLLVILGFAAPKVMMNFTASMGMESISGNFAYSEYERSGDLDCLARSFLIAEVHGDDETALSRWNVLYENEGFSAHCESVSPEGDIPAYSYRDYLTGSAAKVMYRLSSTDEEKSSALAFALSETQASFPQGNPIVALSAEAFRQDDSAFLAKIYSAITQQGFENSADYQRLTHQLEEYHV